LSAQLQTAFADTVTTLVASQYEDPPALVFEWGGENLMEQRYTIRRLTPTECARLQGFPDWWADLPAITDMTDEAFDFWQEVRRVYAGINGMKYKPCKKKQMIRWYNKLRTDSAEYKMWGNGVALPVVRIPLHGMAALGAKTMGSLFDGSGGFPLAGLLDGIETLWASEIEPYPIAVTEWNFSGRAQLLLGGGGDE
jgi:site-specific DNA-cytosine methylase